MFHWFQIKDQVVHEQRFKDPQVTHARLRKESVGLGISLWCQQRHYWQFCVFVKNPIEPQSFQTIKQTITNIIRVCRCKWRKIQECIPVGCVPPAAVVIVGGVWAWFPWISPLGVGLDLIPLNFPLGCGPGPDPPQFPPWLWAWRGVSLAGGFPWHRGSPWWGGFSLVVGWSPWGSPWQTSR